MSFKSLQVLRTKIPLKDSEGRSVSPRTRVVFIRKDVDGRAVTRIADGRLKDLAGVRVTAKSTAFLSTSRGRPRKTA